MRITIYKSLQDESGKAIIEKEKSLNYQNNDQKNNKFDNPKFIAQMLNGVFQANRLTEEHTWLICLKNDCKLLGVFELSCGTIDVSIISNREIFMKALLLNSACIIVAHNHPSGNMSPSKADIHASEKIKEASELMQLPLLDFVIVGDNEYLSFKEKGI